jgi:hypothetical protein
MRVPALLLLCVALLSSGSIAAQAPAEWHDDLVDHLAGTWVMSGNVMGKDAHHKVQADWILNHQFLRVHEKTSASAPKGERPYEAFWFLGYDPDKKQYVMHLMDVYGGTYSETLGYGTRDGDQIRFLFDYPDGPFRTVYRWNAAADTWEWVMDQKDKAGKWTPFADLKLTRASIQ